MCTVLAAASLVTGALGVYAQGKAAEEQAEAQNKANEYNAQMSSRNVQIQQQNAVHAQQKGDREEKLHRLRLSQREGSVRAGQAGSGVLVDSGSTQDVLVDNAIWGELDAMTIQHNTAMSVRGHNIAEGQSQAEIGLHRSKNVDPKFSRNTTLLSGGSRLFNQFAGYKGVF